MSKKSNTKPNTKPNTKTNTKPNTKPNKNINETNDRFNALKEQDVNPFKVASTKQRNIKKPQDIITKQKEQTQPQEENTVYVPISQRNKTNKCINKQQYDNIEILPPKGTVNTQDQMAFPTLNNELVTPQTPTTKNCWSKAGVDIVKSKQRTLTKTENTENIPPGWVRITKSGTINGPPLKNQETTFDDNRFRTYCLEYLKLAKRNRQIVMDDLELYGDEYYHLFGDPEELLNDEDTAFADEDDTSFGDEDSYDGYDRDSGTED